MNLAIEYTTETIESLEDTMRRGGEVIRKIWEAQTEKISQRNLRLAILKGEFSVPENKMSLIRAIQDKEMEIIGSFSRMIDKMAHKFSRSSKNTILDFDDFRSEFLITAIDAMYTFIDPKVKFSTYLSFCMNNKGINLLKEQSSQHVVREADFASEQNLEKEAPSQVALSDVFTMKEVLDSIELTNWEKTVLDGFIQGSNESGWQTRLANSNINPQTGKAYSKPAVKVALDRVLDKVREKLGNVA